MSNCEEMRAKETGGFSTIILAAGKGTRMKSDLAKVLHPLCGAPLLTYPVAAARAAGSGKIVVVIGHQAMQIREKFQDQGLLFVEQRELLGTGHAVLQAADVFRGYDGAVVILCGDVPLILPGTVKALFELHRWSKATVTVLTMIRDEPAGYGRVVKDADGHVIKIVEERDASTEEKKIREVNTGIYCVESAFLFSAVAALGNQNAQGEYYLTDIIEIAYKNGLRAESIAAHDSEEVMGINTPEELELASRRMKARYPLQAVFPLASEI